MEFSAFGYETFALPWNAAVGVTEAQDVDLVRVPSGTLTGFATEGLLPLESVRVRVDGTPLDAVTAAGGSYSFEPVPDGYYEVRFERAGGDQAREGHLRRTLEDLVHDPRQGVSPGLVRPHDGEVAIGTALRLVTDHSLFFEDLEHLENARVPELVRKRLSHLGHRPGAQAPQHRHDVQLPFGERGLIRHPGRSSV